MKHKERDVMNVKTAEEETKLTRANEPTFTSPFRLMRHFAKDMENMFRDFGFDRDFPRMTGLEKDFFDPERRDFFMDFSPPVEMIRQGDNLVVRADLPGMEKDDIKVEVQDNHLIIEGERKQETKEEEEGFYRSECSYGKFYRQIPLPKSVKMEEAKANFKNGVLEVTLAAPQLETSGKKIEISDGSTETKTATTTG